MGLGAGQIAEDADFTAIDATTDSKPIGRLVASGTQTLNDNVETAITFSAEEIDTHGFHSTVSNTSRVTPNVAGYYRFYGSVFFASLTTPVTAEGRLRKNGTDNIAPAHRGPGYTVASSGPTTAIIAMNGTTDYVELIARQDSAGNSSTNQSIQFSSVLEWEYIRGL